MVRRIGSTVVSVTACFASIGSVTGKKAHLSLLQQPWNRRASALSLGGRAAMFDDSSTGVSPLSVRGGGALTTPTNRRSPAETPTGAAEDQDTASLLTGAARGGSLAPLRKRRPTSRIKARVVMCYLLCGSRLFQQSMRNTLTNVLIYMARDLEISTSAKGSLLAAIATGYFFTQIPGGALADTMGAKNVMTGALALSALCCALVPAAGDAHGLAGIWGVMCLMGAVQGPLFPTSSVFLSRWMPSAGPGRPDERAWGTSMLDIGISIGSLLIIPVVTTIAENMGWRNTFKCVGAASGVFVILWMALAASEPKDCWFISQEELDYLEEHIAQPTPITTTTATDNKTTSMLGMPLAMARHPGLWAVFICHIAFNFGAYYLTNWSPTYYKNILGLEPADAKLHLMCPHIANLALRCCNPALIALVARQGHALLASRKLFTVAGYALATAALLPVHSLRGASPWVSTALFSLCNVGFALAPTGFKSNYLDITQQYVGIVAGYGNTLGTLASIVGPKLTAWTLEATQQNWYVVIGMVCAANMVAAANYAKNAVAVPIEELVEEKQV